jgi:hypothetical protein
MRTRLPLTTRVSDAGAEAVEAARSITCGDLTRAGDGVTTGP